MKEAWRHCVVLSSLSCVLLFRPQGLSPTRLLCLWDFPGKNTRVGCYFLLQGIFLTQGLDPGVEPRDRTQVSCIAGRFFTAEPSGKPKALYFSEPVTKGQILCDATYKNYLEYQIYRTRKWDSCYQGLRGREIGQLVFNGYRISVWDDEKVLKMDNGDVCPTVWMELMPLSFTLKNS